MDDSLVGLTSEPLEVSWTPDDAIRYALGIGLGHDDLSFTTENTEGVALRTVPTFGLVLGEYGATVMSALEVDPAAVVHAAEEFTLHYPIPTQGRLTTTTTLTGVFDKGSGALVTLETRATLSGDGRSLFTKTTSAFIRGYGGWGATAAPRRGGSRRPATPSASSGFPRASPRRSCTGYRVIAIRCTVTPPSPGGLASTGPFCTAFARSA